MISMRLRQPGGKRRRPGVGAALGSSASAGAYGTCVRWPEQNLGNFDRLSCPRIRALPVGLTFAIEASSRVYRKD